MRNLIYIFGSLLLLVACDTNRVYEDYKTIDPSGWNKDSVAQFDVHVPEIDQPYNIYINVRNKGNYPNSNLWLFMEIQEPEGKLLTDTVEYILAEKSGKWRGSGIGDLFDNQFVYRKNVVFEKEGTYQFRIQQGMRTEMLTGIHDIGLRIEKLNN
jgi:gliding motility-associated lipoprotein GldH